MANDLRWGMLLPVLIFFVPAALYSQEVSLTSSNLPIVVINTPNGVEIPNEPKITADMGIIFNGEGVVNRISDPFNHYSGKVGIEVRGQSSQSFPMKSYSVELRDISGNSITQPMFGFPKESDWVLYAAYTDKALMRNFLAYHLAREMGRWAPRCRHVEVVVNGNYKGVYVFMEKIKRDSGRVNISKLKTTDISGDELTGGYIFSLDRGLGWSSAYTPPNATNSSKRPFTYFYPDPDVIMPQQRDYIKSAVDAFELSLASPTFQDPFIGVRKYADISSFIDFFIVQEVSRNVDGYRLSSYLYKDKNSKNPRIFAGPMWDFDLAFRNADYCNGSLISGWAYMFNYVCPGDGAGLVPFWWEKFMGADTAFQADFRCRWKSLQKTILNPEHFNAVIDSIANVVQEAQVRHFTRWPILGKYVWPNPQPIAVTYAQELNYLKSWIKDRLEWISNSLPNKGVCYDFPPSSEYTGSIIVNLYSNPIQGEGKMEVKSRYRQELEVTVIDMLGRNMGTRGSLVNPGVNVVSLQSANWRPGIYFVRIVSTTGDKFTFRVVK